MTAAYSFFSAAKAVETSLALVPGAARISSISVASASEQYEHQGLSSRFFCPWNTAWKSAAADVDAMFALGKTEWRLRAEIERRFIGELKQAAKPGYERPA